MSKFIEKVTEGNKRHTQVIKEILEDKKLGRKRYVLAIMKYMEYPSLLFFPDSREYFNKNQREY